MESECDDTSWPLDGDTALWYLCQQQSLAEHIYGVMSNRLLIISFLNSKALIMGGIFLCFSEKSGLYSFDRVTKPNEMILKNPSNRTFASYPGLLVLISKQHFPGVCSSLLFWLKLRQREDILHPLPL